MPPPSRIIVGSRASPLSLAQNEEVLSPLRKTFPDTEFIIKSISTRGDRDKAAPLLSLGRGMFTTDIREALLSGEIDLAIHSAKDVPGDTPVDTVLVPVGVRCDPRDVLVNRWNTTLRDLPVGATLGTSSPRRIAQLSVARNDLELAPIRGNVGTRLEKAGSADYDGVVLAAAGLIRLGLRSRISHYLSPDVCTPDVGQGTLAAEVRSDNQTVLDVLRHAQDAGTVAAFEAERAFLAEIGGGCRSPVAAYARPLGGHMVLRAMAATPDGSRLFRIKRTYDLRVPSDAGKHLVEALLASGADEVIDAQ